MSGREVVLETKTMQNMWGSAKTHDLKGRRYETRCVVSSRYSLLQWRRYAFMHDTAWDFRAVY